MYNVLHQKLHRWGTVDGLPSSPVRAETNVWPELSSGAGPAAVGAAAATAGERRRQAEAERSPPLEPRRGGEVWWDLRGRAAGAGDERPPAAEIIAGGTEEARILLYRRGAP